MQSTLQQRPLSVSFLLHDLLLVMCDLMSWHADYKTDTIIQTSLRNELRNDVTLITVAHRLQTIIDADKVVRVSSFPTRCRLKKEHKKIDGLGRRSHRKSYPHIPPLLNWPKIKYRNARLTDTLALYHSSWFQVEFDRPSELLKRENGRFRSLVDESGDKDLLYAMANKAETMTTTVDASE